MVLPTKNGGLAIFNTLEIANLEYEYSIKATKPLSDIIKQHIHNSLEGNTQVNLIIKQQKLEIILT